MNVYFIYVYTKYAYGSGSYICNIKRFFCATLHLLKDIPQTVVFYFFFSPLKRVILFDENMHYLNHCTCWLPHAPWSLEPHLQVCDILNVLVIWKWHLSWNVLSSQQAFKSNLAACPKHWPHIGVILVLWPLLVEDLTQLKQCDELLYSLINMAFSFQNRFGMPKIQGNKIKFPTVFLWMGENCSVAKSTSCMLTRRE